MKTICNKLLYCAVAGIALMMTGTVSAQKEGPLIVDMQRISSAYTQSVPNLVAENPECKTEVLRQTASATIAPDRLAAIKKQKASKRTLTNEEIYNTLCKSTYILGRYYKCPDCGRMHTMPMATAFSISDDGIMATNYHVLENVLTQRPDTANSDSAYFVTDIDGRCFLISRVLAYSRGNDLAVFQIDNRGVKLDCIALGQTAPTGSHVSIVANPGELFYEYTEGVVTRNYVATGRRQTYRMEVSAGYAVGASGGPIVDDCCNMVGMVSSTNTLYSNPDRNEHRDPQMVVKVSIPVSCMRQLLGL